MSTTVAAVNRPVPVSTSALALLCACFVFSGFAALVYQTGWTRQFAIVFGTSELAVATVLAAYMGGLAFGAWLVERFLPRLDRPVLTYALLELGIAGGAVLVVPALLWLANLALQALFGGQPTPPDSDHAATTLFYLLSAFVALAVPTTLMGATLPLLARYAVAEEKQIGRRIGTLYAMNTAGAVFGALTTAFYLLPEFGLAATTWIGAAINLLVFVLAVILSRSVPYTPPPRGYSLERPASPAAPPRPARLHSFREFPGPAWVLPLMLLAGAVAFFQEVLWSRMFAHVVGSSIYAFGVMVASFLAGIALGGGVGAVIARTRRSAAAALGTALIVAAGAAAVAYLQLENLLPDTAGLLANVKPVAGIDVSRNALLAGLLLLPMTIAIGTTYPLAVRVLAADAADAAPASARVYAWNTVGAILGSLAAGFVLIPTLRFEGAIQVAVWASALFGIAALWILARESRVPVVFAGAMTLIALAGAASFWPKAPLKLLMTSPLNVGGGRLLSYEVGRSASVVLLSQDGSLALRTNGLPEAMMDEPGSLPRFSGEFWLSPIAVIARPATRNMLVVGYGGGVVAEGIPPSVSQVDIIELEPQVIEANRKSIPLRRRDPLADPRIKVIENDARGALRLTSKRYDAIISQPSHPFTAGASHLYTQQFVRLAHEHLNDNGVFVQWMNVIFMDEDLLRSLTATLLSVFREVRVYRPDPNTLLFLASDAPLNFEARVAATGEPLRDAPLHYQRFGINNAEDLIAALYLDTDGARRLSAGSPLITDDDNRIATSSVYEHGRGMTGDSSGRLLAGEDPLQRRDSFIYTELRGTLSFPYLARRLSTATLLDPSLVDRIGRMANHLGESPDAEYAHAAYFRARNEHARATERLRLAINEYPNDVTLRQEYLRPWLGGLVTGEAPADATEVAAGLDARTRFMIETMRHAVKSEWIEVAKADQALAEFGWSDAYHAEAADLRINWRLRVSNPEQRKRFAEEAIMLIDRQCLLTPNLQLYGLRARAGFGVERPEIVIESVAAFARFDDGLFRSRVKTVDALRHDQQVLRTILDNAARMPGANTTRVAEVRTSVEGLTAGR